MSNPNEYLPAVVSVTPVALAHEAVMHHAGANALAAHAGPDARAFDTRELFQAEKPTPGPWVADAHLDWHSPRLEVRDSGGRSIARVWVDDDGVQAKVCGTRGKAEIEWANAALIARMREREPIIAAECIRLDGEVRRLRAIMEAAGIGDRLVPV